MRAVLWCCASVVLLSALAAGQPDGECLLAYCTGAATVVAVGHACLMDIHTHTQALKVVPPYSMLCLPLTISHLKLLRGVDTVAVNMVSSHTTIWQRAHQHLSLHSDINTTKEGMQTCSSGPYRGTERA